MSYLGHFLKQFISLKMHETILHNRFELESQRMDAREERATQLAIARQNAQDRLRKPKLVAFEVHMVGKRVGLISVPEYADVEEIVKNVEFITEQRIVESAVQDDFYFMKTAHGVIIKARLK